MQKIRVESRCIAKLKRGSGWQFMCAARVTFFAHTLASLSFAPKHRDDRFIHFWSQRFTATATWDPKSVFLLPLDMN